MCVGMNGDLVAPGERCASTSNRNFVGRQGPGARTHLVSPAMAAAAAVDRPLHRRAALLAASEAKMERFQPLDAVAAPLPMRQCRHRPDHPGALPAQAARAGLGQYLFHDLRFDDGGAPRPDFVLNRPEYRGARDHRRRA